MYIVTGFESAAGECLEDRSSRDPVANAECWVARRRGMKDAGVGLERLFRREIT